MKKLSLLALVLLMVLSVSSVFAGGSGEQIIDPEADEQEGQFAGLTDVDHTSGEFETGVKGGRYVLSSISDPRSFNAVIAAETSTTDITGQLYAALIRRNQFTLEWEPWIAESYEISDDNLSVTFDLPEGLQWSDGEPLTAHDWVDGRNELIMDPEIESNARSSQFVGGEPATWEALDDYTIRVTTPELYAGLLTLSSLSPVPMHIFGPVYESEGAAGIRSLWGVDSDPTEIVGNGPFLLQDYVPGQRVVLRANPNYAETDADGTQLPYLEEVVFSIVPDQDTSLQQFTAGQLDSYGLRGEDYATLVDLQEEQNFTIYNVGPSSSTQFLTMNQNPIRGEGDAGLDEPKVTWMNNKTFRQAIAYLVDRETIINNVAFGFGYPQYSPIWTNSPYYWDGAPDAAFEYDPGRAEELLDSIDYIDRDGDGYREDPDGNKIELVLETNTSSTARVQIGEIVSQEMQNVGLDVTFRPGDFNAIVGKLLSSYDWEMIIIGLTGSVDPISGANVYPSSGNLHMVEPLQEEPQRDWEARVDEAWDVANLTLDEEQRKRGYQTLQEIWIEEVPWVFTYNAAVMGAYRSNWGNIYPHPIDGYGTGALLEVIYDKDRM